MAFFETAVERAAGLGAGVCVAALGGSGILQSLGGAAVAGVGLYALFHEATKKGCIDCSKELAKLARDVKQQLIVEDPDYETEYENAAERLSELLLLVLPGREDMAALAVSPDGFVAAGVKVVLADLKAKGAGFDRFPEDERLAKAVITKALELAFTGAGQLPKLEPHLWLEALRSLGEIKADTAAIRQTQALHTSALTKIEAAVQDHGRGAYADITAHLDVGYEPFEGAILARPSAMLVAKYAVIPYFDAYNQIGDLLDWCDADIAIAGRLYSGRGGVGKTRLLLEACKRLTERGWLAGILKRSNAWALASAWDGFEAALKREPERAILVGVDYAETREGDIRELAAHLRGSAFAKRRVRVVCIARAGGDWWRGLTEIDGRPTDFFEAADREELDEPWSSAIGARFWEHCASALDRHGLARGKHKPPPPKWFSEADGEGNGRPLSIAIDAYLKLSGSKQDKRPLLEALAARERPLWSAAIGKSDPLSLFRAECAVASSTLLQGIDLSAGPAVDTPLRVLAEVPTEPLLEEGSLDEIINALAPLYPMQDALGPIEPDILGEHILGAHLLVLGRPDWRRTKRRKPFAEEYLRRTWERASSEQRFWLLTVLNRATRAEHKATGVSVAADQAIEMLGDLPFDEPAATARACLTDVGRLAPLIALRFGRASCERLQGLMQEVVKCHDMRRSWFARELDGAIERRCRNGSPGRGPPSGSADDIDRSRREAALGRRDEAIDTARQAFKEGASNQERAAALLNLSERYADDGRIENALEAVGQAVHLYRSFASADTEAPTALAKALDRLGDLSSRQGRRQEALDASTEAVELYRRCVSISDMSEADLAGALEHHATNLASFGRLEEAHVASLEGIQIYRALVERGHTIYLAALAFSLNKLGSVLSALGRREEALRGSQEATDIMRRMARQSSEAFLPGLVISLNALSLRFAEVGRRDDALRAAMEAAESASSVFGPDHPETLTSLANLAAMNASMGDLERAREIQERVLVKRTTILGREHPSTLTALLAQAGTLSDMGDLETSVRLTDEAVTIATRVFGPNHPDTLAGLSKLATLLSKRGDLDAAQQLQERVLQGLQASLGPDHPSTLQSGTNLAATLLSRGDLRGAQELLEQTLALEQRSGGDSDASMNNRATLAAIARARGDLAGAEHLQEEVLARRRRSFGSNHPVTLTNMMNLATTYTETGKLDRANALLEEALDGYEKLGRTGDAEVFNTMEALAGNHRAWGDFPAEHAVLERLYSRRVALLGESHADAQRTKARMLECAAILNLRFAESMQKSNREERLLCALIVDGSASMVGEPIRVLNEALEAFQRELQNDEMASRRVQLLVVRVGGTASVVSEWVDAVDFVAPTIDADGNTPLGVAVDLTLSKIKKQTELLAANGIRWKKPWVFLMTDGSPTDGPIWDEAAARLRQAQLQGKVIAFPIAIGADADVTQLKKAVPDDRPVIRIEKMDFERMFTFISNSSQSASRKADGVAQDMGPWGKVVV